MVCERRLTYFPSGALDNSCKALITPTLWYGNASLPSEPVHDQTFTLKELSKSCIVINKECLTNTRKKHNDWKEN